MLRRAFIVLLIVGVAAAVPLPGCACTVQGAKPCGSQGPARMTLGGRMVCPTESSGITCHCMRASTLPAMTPTASSDVRVRTPAARPAVLIEVVPRIGAATMAAGVHELATPTRLAQLCTLLI